MRSVCVLLLAFAGSLLFNVASAQADKKDPKLKLAARRGLDWLVGEQHRSGYWEANQGQYRVAMTALVGNAMISEGSTTTRGHFAKPISLAVDYLVDAYRAPAPRHGDCRPALRLPGPDGRVGSDGQLALRRLDHRRRRRQPPALGHRA